MVVTVGWHQYGGGHGRTFKRNRFTGQPWYNCILILLAHVPELLKKRRELLGLTELFEAHLFGTSVTYSYAAHGWKICWRCKLTQLKQPNYSNMPTKAHEQVVAAKSFCSRAGSKPFLL